jgi:DNA-binding response OmpR family regulator
VSLWTAIHPPPTPSPREQGSLDVGDFLPLEVKFFEDCISENEIELQKLNIEIKLENTLQGGGLVLIDRDRMKRVVVNIVNNAAKYMDSECGIARVNAHIAKYERLTGKYVNEAKSESITVRGLELQKDSRRVFINGTEINMAHKEFDLLLFLLQNPNRVFGREELFERIWGVDSLGDAATVTVHIARIREKIESNPSNPQYIETVWGAGYRFRA